MSDEGKRACRQARPIIRNWKTIRVVVEWKTSLP
jgi:hypothetical protein